MRILGLSFANDSAAAFVENGRVICASAEERFSRIKHDRNFPLKAMNFCLAEAGCGIDDLDAVAFFWNPGIHAQAFQYRQSVESRNHLEYLFNVPNHLLSHVEENDVDFVEQKISLRSGTKIRIVFVTHHMAHAASAFFSSVFDEAATLTVDGYGERTSALVCDASGTTINPVSDVEFPDSIGSVYAAFTEYLGFRPNSGEGKVMGLASYGTPGYKDEFDKLIRLTPDGFEVDQGYFSYTVPKGRRYSPQLVKMLGEPRAPDAPIDERHMNIAASLQLATEEALIHLAKFAREKTGRKNLCASGGVMLNCVANTRIVREAGFEKCFFQPAASDAGTAAGAALWVEHCLESGRRDNADPTDYYGLKEDTASIEKILTLSGVRFSRVDDPCAEAARLLVGGKIIGCFQGRAEYGPRALGNRSIIADPRNRDMKDILNARVKFREPFRPFAPSVTEEDCGILFDSEEPSPFMLRVYRTKQDKLDVIPSVTHVDGWARVQTVSRSQNQRYYDLINAFRKETGVGAVLNTSFNIRGEPIVNTAADALKCFCATGMDFLLMENFLINKSDI